MRNILIIIVVLILVALGVYVLIPSSEETPVDTDTEVNQEETQEDEEQELAFATQTIIGQSVNGNDITAYHYGNGDTKLLFVGGIHGGYEWNTVLVARELMDYIEDNPERVPENIRLTVVPALNPDGLEEVVGTAGDFSENDVPTDKSATIPGRFNGNNVDLNRNFDCDWQSVGVWQNNEVDGGDAVFSEPEAKAIRDYVNLTRPDGVVVYYSAVGGVFASNCHEGVLPETKTMTNLYADASGYQAYEEFNFYDITGDMVNWLAKENIPAISVLLSTHEDVEWSRNRAGIEALLEYFGKSSETEEVAEE